MAETTKCGGVEMQILHCVRHELEVCWWSWRSHFEKWNRRSLRVAVKQEGSDTGGATS